MRRLLAFPDARLYLAGQTVSLFGDTSLWLAMGIWVKSLTGSSTAAGLVFFAFALPQLFSPLSGLLVDRVRRRPLLIAANLLTGAVVLLLLLVHGRADVWVIYLVMFLYGASYTVLGAAQSALLTVILPDELLADGNGALQTIREGLRLIAPLAGAGLFAWQGGAAVALVDAGTFLIAAVALGLMRVKEASPMPAARRWRAELAAGLTHITRTTVLRQLVIATALTLLVVGFSETIAFAVVGQGLQRPPTFLGVLLAVQGVGAIIGGVTAATVMRRTSEGALCGLGMAIFACGAPLLATASLPVVFAGVVLFGLSLPWIIVGAYTLLQRATPPHLQGRAYAAVELLTGVPQTVSIALGAALVAIVDYRLLLIIMALVVALAAVYLLTRKEQWQRAIVVDGQTSKVCIRYRNSPRLQRRRLL